jgi:hypothetical protein
VRWWILVMSIAGCYSPAGDASCVLVCEIGASSCPSGLSCIGGMCRDPMNPVCPSDDGMPGDGANDSSNDAPIDGSVTTCVTGSFSNHTTVAGAVGDSYSRNVSDLAVFESNAGIQQITSPGGMVSAVAFNTASPDTLSRPKLSASTVDGKAQMILVSFDGVSRTLVKSSRVNGATWDAR